MFFSRLRRHAKWMFVFLALVFAVGFVGFGIGANQNASIGDLLRGSGGTSDGSVSVSDAREAVAKSPKSAAAQRSLATALQEDGQTDEATVVLNRYLDLRPKDKEALQELAGLHLSRANALARDAQEAQVRASYITFGSTFSVPLDLGKGATLGPDRSTRRSRRWRPRLSTRHTRLPRRPTRQQRRPTTGSPSLLRATRTSSSSWRRQRSRAAIPSRRSRLTSSS